MTNEERFKKSLQEKIESKEFAFDEKEWDKAAAIIDSSRRGGSKGIIYFASGALLLLLGYMTFNSSSPIKANDSKITASITPAVKSTNNLYAEKEVQTVSATEAVSTPVSVTENNINPPKSKIAVPAIASTQNSPNKIESEATTVNSTTTKQTNPVKETTIEKTTTTETKDNSVTKTEESFPIVNSSNENNTPVIPPTNETNVSGNDPIKAAAAIIAVSTEESIPQQLTKEISKNEIVPAETNALISNPDKTPAKEVEENKTVSANTNSATVAPAVATDTNVPALQNPTVTPHNMLNFELGTSYMFGWKNEDGRDANGFTPVIGINYLSNIVRNYWFSFGIQYNAVKNLSYSSKTSKVTRYKLGEESDVTTITPSKLHYLTFPLKLQYQLNEKNSFGAAYTISYLFNVESKVETYTQKLYSTENHESYTTGGYTEGFRLFSSQAGIFYKRQLCKNLSVNTEFIFGLNDIKEDAFFNSNTIERNTGIKVTLTYNLFKH